MKRTSMGMLLCVTAFACGIARAGEDAPAQPMGEATRGWLELQRSGQVASDTSRPLSADAARRSYQRYIETHSYKIPESYAEQDQEFVRGNK